MNKFYQEKIKQGYPPIKSKWRSRKHGTRLVIDYDLGGRIVFLELYANKSKAEKRESLSDWQKYQSTAKQII